MLTDFYSLDNSLILAGDTIETINFYKDGAVLATVSEITEHTISNNTISSVYDGCVRRAFIDFEIKRANKLNLNRKDAFFIKNPEHRYSFDKPYILYIYADLVDFRTTGEVISLKQEHETSFIESYTITLKKAGFIRNIYEREICDNYTLKDGEKFSEHGFGCDREHACISFYNLTENSFIIRKHPERVNEKGIVRRYFKSEIVNDCIIILRGQFISRWEKDSFLLNLENISSELKNNNVNLSVYDLQKIEKAGYTIIKK